MSCSSCAECTNCGEKPRVKISNAKITTTWVNLDVLEGVVGDYPENHGAGSRLSGKKIITSAIVKIDGDIVETRNTIYEVESWA